jgi:hypothetical protein
MTDDEKISQRYRELGAEEPPRALDDAILAAARRPTSSWSKRWAMPLSLAAVVVLSITVTLRIQHEQPEIAAPAPAAQIPAKPAADIVAKVPPERLQRKAEVPAKPAEPRVFVPDPSPSPAPALQAEVRVPASAPAASASGAVAGLAGERDMRADVARDRPRPLAATEAMAKRAEAPARVLAETPERELERIAALRGQGRYDEADRALAEFRRRYPDFKISDEIRARVERR